MIDKEAIKAWLIDFVTSPLVWGPVGMVVIATVIFLFICFRVRSIDKRGGAGVKPGVKASELVRGGAISGVKWPEPSPPSPPGSMIIEPGPHGHTVRNGPDKIKVVFVRTGGDRPTKADLSGGTDLTDVIESVAFGPTDTQPIEVTSDGEASRRKAPDREHRSDPDQDRERTRARALRARAARRSRGRRRTPRSGDR